MASHPLRWRPAGRRLHLVDLENLAGPLHRDPMAIAGVAELYRTVASVATSDLAVVACNPGLAIEAGRSWPGAQLQVRHGADGADLALLGAVDPARLADRFDGVVIGSGDGIFASLAAQLRLLGLDVTVVARPSGLARRLERVAKQVILWPVPKDADPLAAAA